MKFLIIFINIALSIFSITAEDILNKVDYNMTPLSIRQDAEMIIHKGNRILRKSMTIEALGDDKGFIEFTAPRRDAGTRYLRDGDNLWIYFPDANRTMKISGHMLRQGMMGSDISYEDQTNRTKLLEQYDAKILDETDEIYSLELTAKSGVEVTYEIRRIEVHKEKFIILNSLMYARSGKLLKELNILDYLKIGDRYVSTHIRMDDKIMTDSYTEIISSNINIDVEIPISTFTLQNLERRR